jgi:hypothetical protein
MDSAFEESVLSHSKPGAIFQPFAAYDPDGDCIEFLTSDEGYRAERIDSLLTVYHGRKSGEIIGALLTGVSRFIKDIIRHSPGFLIEIEDGRIKMEHLFTARLWSSEADRQETWVHAYKKLRGVAERHHAELQLDELQLVG